MLTVTDLHKTFPGRGRGAEPVRALDGVDVHVREGDFATVLGPSGSGKSTLMRCIAGFERPDRGTIELGGRVLDGPRTASVRPDHRGIGIVPQEGALFPHLDVARNIGFGLRDLGRGERRDRIDFLLDLVELRGYEKRRPHQISGGQQQRVALARALAPEPRLILLDEPYSALDAKLRIELRQQVRELLRATGTTAVLVTHDQSEALTIADHLVVMRDGRVIAAGTPREVYGTPADLELALFLGDATVLDGTAATDGATVDCALGRIPIRAWHGSAGSCRVLVRPEQLTARAHALAPDLDDSEVVNGARRIRGTVGGIEFHGDHSVLRVAIDGIDQPIPIKELGERSARPGDRVEVTVEGGVTTYDA